MKIFSVWFKNHPVFGSNKIQLAKKVGKNKNCYSFIIGDNGTGKSFLARSVINKIVAEYGNQEHLNQHYEGKLDHWITGSIPNFLANGGVCVYDNSPFNPVHVPDDHRWTHKHPNCQYMGREHSLEKFKYLLLSTINKFELAGSFQDLKNYIAIDSDFQIEISGNIKKSEFSLENYRRIKIGEQIPYEGPDHVASHGTTLHVHGDGKGGIVAQPYRKSFLHIFKLKELYGASSMEIITNRDFFEAYREKANEVAARLTANKIFDQLVNENQDFRFTESELQEIELIDIQVLQYLDDHGLIDIKITHSNGVSIDQLSSGQKYTLKFFSIFGDFITAISSRENILFFVDEPENSLYQRLQLEYFSRFQAIVEDIFEVTDSHFIFLTHSPTLILDPGGSGEDNINVVKLEKENGFTKSTYIYDINKFNIEALLLNTFEVSYRDNELVDVIRSIFTGQESDKELPVSNSMRKKLGEANNIGEVLNILGIKKNDQMSKLFQADDLKRRIKKLRESL